MLEVIVDDSMIWSQVPTRPLKILGLETDHHKTDNKNKQNVQQMTLRKSNFIKAGTRNTRKAKTDVKNSTGIVSDTC